MNLIVAADAAWGIGKDGEQMVYIAPDLKRFRRLTSGHPILVGRKTLATFPGGRPATALETRCTMALICPSSSARPGNRFTVTDAEGDFCSRTNKDGFGIARCTRAPFTGPIVSMVRESSPSSAR